MRLLDPIVHADDTLLAGAMRATKHVASRLDPMADDGATAVAATGSQRVDGAFKGIEIMGDAIDDDLHHFVVFVAADFTFIHILLLSRPVVLRHAVFTHSARGRAH